MELQRLPLDEQQLQRGKYNHIFCFTNRGPSSSAKRLLLEQGPSSLAAVEMVFAISGRLLAVAEHVWKQGKALLLVEQNLWVQPYWI